MSQCKAAVDVFFIDCEGTGDSSDGPAFGFHLAIGTDFLGRVQVAAGHVFHVRPRLGP